MIVKNSRWLAGLLFLTAVLLVGFKSPTEGVKATWVWQTELIEDGGEQLLDFAGQEGINLIYLQINRDLPKGTYEQFIQNAHAGGIAVHALGGDPRWALLRHSFATDYYLQNDIYKTKEQLGHASTETTEVYAHLTDKTMSEAIERRTDS